MALVEVKYLGSQHLDILNKGNSLSSGTWDLYIQLSSFLGLISKPLLDKIKLQKTMAIPSKFLGG